MPLSPRTKAEAFLKLHTGPGAFVIANVWDAGSARQMAGLGFKALATSSGAAAGTLGRVDGKLSRAEAMAHAEGIAAATDLPVSGDLENGFGDTPEDAATTIRDAAAAGLSGASIEDFSGKEVYPLDLAVKRIEAAVAAARALPHPFVLTARSENFLRGKPDLADTLARLKAYEAAGADCLMAPGLPDLAAVRQVCQSLTKPVNYMVALPGKTMTKAQLEDAGVRRISLATSLYRAAMTGLIEAAREVAEKGTFTYVDRALPTSEIVKHYQR
ncbi:MAG: isocitrate lyase/phosphoenolpyruvate mutase family protein [Hyphomicrobiaceae bacterium]